MRATFERFTERARQVIVLAQEEARAQRHNYIGTEHILLGLLREEEGLGCRVLESLDVTLESTRKEVVRIVGHGDEAMSGQIPFTPRAKKVCELGLREALSLGHNYIGTEHILLGLVRENEGVGSRILGHFDADAEKVRGEVMRMLSGPGGRRATDPAGLSYWLVYAPGQPPKQAHGSVESVRRTARRIAGDGDDKVQGVEAKRVRSGNALDAAVSAAIMGVVIVVNEDTGESEMFKVGVNAIPLGEPADE